MRQGLHIFRKDLRALWPQILLVLALTASVTGIQLLEPQPYALGSLPFGSLVTMLTVALAVARWYLIACAVHQEKLAGDRQFWVTRPYRWTSLLAAKALLVVAVAHVPSLLSDAVIVKGQGLPLAPAWSVLLLRQAAIAGAFLLPAAALAVVTEGLASFALAGLGLVVAVMLPPMFDTSLSRWGTVMWIPMLAAPAAIGLAGAAVVIWQYGWRRTTAARGALGAGVVLCAAMYLLPPSGLAVAIHAHMLPAPQGLEKAELRFATITPVKTPVWDRQHGTLSLVAHVEGLPAGMSAQPDIEDLQIETATARWRSGWTANHWANMSEWRENSMSFVITPAELGTIPEQPATIRLSVVMTVLAPEQSQMVNLRGGAIPVEALGICRLGDTWQGRGVNCIRWARPDVQVYIPEIDYSFYLLPAWPFTVSVGPSPVWRTEMRLLPEKVGKTAWNGEPITVRTRKPVARLRKQLVVEKIRLADYR